MESVRGKNDKNAKCDGSCTHDLKQIALWFFRVAARATAFMGQRPEGPEARAGFGVGDVVCVLDGVLRGFGAAADSVNSENSLISGGVGEYNGV